jgi:hypothetical protein
MVPLLVRSIALAVAFSVAGLSSALVVCVTSCTDENRPLAAPDGMSCHEETAAATRIVAPDRDCRHQPARQAENGELIRHNRETVVPAIVPTPVLLMPGIARDMRVDPPVESPLPPVRIHPRVLRI